MNDSELDVAMKAFRRAVALAGGQVAFEQLTGLKQQTVSYRLRNRIPLRFADEVLTVEAATGVSRHELRPDLYPPEDSLPTPAGRTGDRRHPQAAPTSGTGVPAFKTASSRRVADAKSPRRDAKSNLGPHVGELAP